MYKYQHFTQFNYSGNLTSLREKQNCEMLRNIQEPGVRQFCDFLQADFCTFCPLYSFTISICKHSEGYRIDSGRTLVFTIKNRMQIENIIILVWIKACWNSFFSLSSTHYCPHSEVLVQMIVDAFLQNFSLYTEFCELL